MNLRTSSSERAELTSRRVVRGIQDVLDVLKQSFTSTFCCSPFVDVFSILEPVSLNSLLSRRLKAVALAVTV